MEILYLKRIIVLLAFVLIIQYAYSQTNIPVNHPDINYIGRWDKSNDNEYHSYWGGAYVKIKFTGTSLKMNLNKNATLIVSIDGGEDVQIAAKTGIVDINSAPLEEGTHIAIIAAQKRNDEILTSGFVLDEGAKTLALPQAEIIEYIGNSITSADMSNKDFLSAYAWHVGRMLPYTEHTQIAMPGITLVDGYSYYPGWGGAPRKGMDFQYFCMKEPNVDFETKWDFSNYTPKIVVINIGTNDYRLNVPSDLFKTRYKEFVKNVRKEFPSTEIFLMKTLMTFFADETEDVVNEFNAEGDNKIHFIDTEGWLTEEDYYKENFPNDTTHPNDDGHYKIAQNLAPILEPFLTAPVAVIELSEITPFDSTEVGQTSDVQVLKITNTGNRDLSISDIELPDGFDCDWKSGLIEVGQNQKINMVFKPTELKNYTGTLNIISDADEGNNTIAVSGIAFTRTSVELIQNTHGLKFYPNPVSSILNVELMGDMNTQLSIYNDTGQKIHSVNTVNSHEIIDLAKFEKGIYFLQIISEGRKSTGKFLLE
jgi:hypothetical protein